jgi:hypothetical protein
VAGRKKTEFRKICLYGTWKKVYQCLQKTHKLTPWSRVYLEKLIIPQLVMKFPAFYET